MCINAERGSLGTDKSVPYGNRVDLSFVCLSFVRLSFVRLPFVCLLWRSIVGDGFIRPEVCTLVNSWRVTCINAERGSLGTDKSVPCKNRVDFVVCVFVVCAFVVRVVAVRAFVVAVNCRGRIYPSRGMHARQFGVGNVH
ncbi:MAG: hypothetical protein FWG87_12270 [Defluviitaleaceae bacterium]|nr:hypothetical protein [Defluviitaleaceae bacterium]